jgi:hypothetical protein
MVGADDQRGGRVIQLREEIGIVGLAEEQVTRAETVHRGKFAFRKRHGGNHGRFPAATRGKLGQGGDRGIG